MEYRVRHRTLYRYLQDVFYSRHFLHLTPRDTAHQTVLDSRIDVHPPPEQRHAFEDAFGNHVACLSLEEPHSLLEIVAESRVLVSPPAPRDAEAAMAWEDVRAAMEAPGGGEARDAVQYMFDTPLTAFRSDIASYAARSFTPRRPLLAAAAELMARIHDDFRYDTTVTDATTPVDRVFEIRAGVCQDLAHVGIACLRSLGLPARYVSGYLLTHPPPGREKLIGADASHAWFSVYAPPQGWVDLDPTNNLMPGNEHVTVGWGRDYGDVAPINGVVTGGSDHMIEVGVDLRPADGAA